MAVVVAAVEVVRAVGAVVVAAVVGVAVAAVLMVMVAGVAAAGVVSVVLVAGEHLSTLGTTPRRGRATAIAVRARCSAQIQKLRQMVRR